jgi:fumarate reductase subunit C
MSGRFKPAVKTFTRPVTGSWWKENPFFLVYMAREATALFVFIYALVLLSGVVSLALGQGAYEAWRAALATKTSLVFHLILLVLVGYHTYTWFKVMPKTTPQISIAPQTIVRTGVGFTAVLSLVIVAVLFGVTK